MMRWGTPPPPRTGGPPVTNIRNTTSPYWRGWPKPANRCLVPFNSFAEHAPEPNPETKKKDVVWFALNEDRPLCACAGIWTEYKGDRGTKSTPIPGPHLVYGLLRVVECRGRADPPKGNAAVILDHRGGARGLDARARDEARHCSGPSAARPLTANSAKSTCNARGRTILGSSARPLPPSADIGPGGQSVGQAAQFCLEAEMLIEGPTKFERDVPILALIGPCHPVRRGVLTNGVAEAHMPRLAADGASGALWVSGCFCRL